MTREGETGRRRGRSEHAAGPKPQIQVPDPVRELIGKLEDEGFETWTVGGGVRDALRGSPSDGREWDLATRATPRQVRRLFKRTVPLGMEYGTVGVFGSDRRLYEVTTFRHDVVTYGRKAKVAFADTLDEDLARRDFTVNAMAWHPRHGELRDLHGGRDDLDNKVLRAVGSPRERFREDYLRVLRGLRFAGALDMTIDPATWDGMVEAVPGLSRLSMERVREELEKVLSGPRPSRALELYHRSGALQQILPELGEGASPEAMATVDHLDQDDWLLRMTALLLFGMRTGDATAGRVADLLARLRFSNADAERIGAVVRGGLSGRQAAMGGADDAGGCLHRGGHPSHLGGGRPGRSHTHPPGRGGSPRRRHPARPRRRDPREGRRPPRCGTGPGRAGLASRPRYRRCPARPPGRRMGRPRAQRPCHPAGEGRGHEAGPARGMS